MYFHFRQEFEITNATWDRYRQIRELLQPFKTTTVQLSSQSVPTLSSVCPLIKTLHVHCQVQATDAAVIAELRAALKLGLQERFDLTGTGYPRDLEQPCVMASLFDPRYFRCPFINRLKCLTCGWYYKSPCAKTHRGIKWVYSNWYPLLRCHRRRCRFKYHQLLNFFQGI